MEGVEKLNEEGASGSSEGAESLKMKSLDEGGGGDRARKTKEDEEKKGR